LWLRDDAMMGHQVGSKLGAQPANTIRDRLLRQAELFADLTCRAPGRPHSNDFAISRLERCRRFRLFLVCRLAQGSVDGSIERVGKWVTRMLSPVCFVSIARRWQHELAINNLPGR
jgi:hypothetical protein